MDKFVVHGLRVQGTLLTHELEGPRSLQSTISHWWNCCDCLASLFTMVCTLLCLISVGYRLELCVVIFLLQRSSCSSMCILCTHVI